MCSHALSAVGMGLVETAPRPAALIPARRKSSGISMTTIRRPAPQKNRAASCPASFLRRRFNRRHHPRVRAAAADMSVHAAHDFLSRGARRLGSAAPPRPESFPVCTSRTAWRRLPERPPAPDAACPPAASPSMVTMRLPATRAHLGDAGADVVAPSTSTVQAAHCPSPQPYLVPVKSRSSRKTLSSVRSALASTRRRVPLTSSSVILAISPPSVPPRFYRDLSSRVHYSMWGRRFRLPTERSIAANSLPGTLVPQNIPETFSTRPALLMWGRRFRLPTRTFYRRKLPPGHPRPPKTSPRLFPPAPHY